jgi:hypothetical protein
MKKIFLTIATIGLLGTSVYAADGGKKATKVPAITYTVSSEFDSTFSEAKNVNWTVTSNVQKATFTMNDVKMTAFYNLQGEYLGVTQDVAYTTLDVKAQKQIAAKYADYKVGEVIKLTTADNQTNSDQTVYFVDLAGKSDELLVRVTPSDDVYFFQKVK